MTRVARDPSRPVTTLELVCPAGTPAALRTAVDAGAHTVYCGFRDETNARNFPGLNFNRAELREGVAYAHDHGADVLVAINTFPEAGNLAPWHRAIDDAAEIGADAAILADIGLVAYARDNCPNIRRHLSVQAAASTPEGINFYAREFGISRVVLPRVLTLPEIKELNRHTDVETEVFVFGGLCVMAEGRCSLSSYVTGKSPNKTGVCSPASHVAYEEHGSGLDSKLGGFTINRFAEGEPAGYPTLCKGRFSANDKVSYLFEEPVSLNLLTMLPEVADAGVTALKIEGRQRGKAYVEKVVRAFRKAVDALDRGEQLDAAAIADLTEGGRETAGAYKKAWH
ncbi:ubiquinone anaerobic biosynthesis protein UbiU [Oleispirillum naphthae]|uniref:ubiquinone anaerobic biosynthesis protein UbiU n=1 Tax=Oleispirillum naphthae TaxID=2838853 RepID=UPI0030824879